MILGVSGHRPKRLGEVRNAQSRLDDLAMAVLERLGPKKVLTGMALGWDTAFASACCWMGIPYIAVIPFVGQESKWPVGMQRVYHAFLKTAESVTVTCGEYSSHAYQLRNEQIVLGSDRMCFLWDGEESGGTWGAYQSCIALKKPYINVWSSWQKYAKR